MDVQTSLYAIAINLAALRGMLLAKAAKIREARKGIFDEGIRDITEKCMS